MRITAIGDMHGDLDPAYEILQNQKPDLLLCCGDWGDPGAVNGDDFTRLLGGAYILTVFGNHDDIDLLKRTKNIDGTPILLENSQVRTYGGIKIAGINGIWAKSHRLPWYVTDEDVAEISENLTGIGVDILITHGCPVGLADLTPSGRHGGQRCFLDAFKALKPKLHLCGHLHRKGLRKLKDGSLVVNIGETRRGDFFSFQVKGGQIMFNGLN